MQKNGNVDLDPFLISLFKIFYLKCSPLYQKLIRNQNILKTEESK